MSFSIYLHEDFIKVPLPVARLQAPCSSLFNFACELKAKPVPPVQDSFIDDIYTTLMNQVFYFPQREWKPHIQHHRKLDDLWTGFKVAEGYRIGHSWVANCRDSLQQGGLF